MHKKIEKFSPYALVNVEYPACTEFCQLSILEESFFEKCGIYCAKKMSGNKTHMKVGEIPRISFSCEGKNKPIIRCGELLSFFYRTMENPKPTKQERQDKTDYREESKKENVSSICQGLKKVYLGSLDKAYHEYLKINSTSYSEL